MSTSKNSVIKLYSKFSILIHEVWVVLFPTLYAKYYYRLVMNKKLNLRNPRYFHEKVQWLKIHSDTSLWTKLADKYKVREYIKQCQLNNILVKLYGVWKKADDIDFNLLPDQFVLKTNNGCGKNLLVFDKSEMDIYKTKKLLDLWVNERTGLIDFQPHMWNIDRIIIAEELLEDDYNKKLSFSIIDYKFYCFHGEPEIIVVFCDRENHKIGENISHSTSEKRIKYYDINWNSRSDVIASDLMVESPDIPKPKNLDEMLRICRILSKPFPQVRVDLYEVNNKVYFGELTFTSGGMTEFKPEYLLELGSKIDLSLAKKRTKLFII